MILLTHECLSPNSQIILEKIGDYNFLSNYAETRRNSFIEGYFCGTHF